MEKQGYGGSLANSPRKEVLVWSSLSWEGADLRQLCLLLEAQFQRRREPGRRSCLSSHCKTDLLLGLPLAQTKKSTNKVGMADCVSMEDTKAYESRRGGTGVGWDPPNSRP